VVIADPFLDAHLVGAAEHVQLDVLELDADVLADHAPAGQHGHVLRPDELPLRVVRLPASIAV